jgi:uncharacterized damage-inducible protein DinB
MKLAFALSTVLALVTSPALAQDPQVASAKQVLQLIKGNVVKSAEQMSEENYAFKPTPEVRSFGQIIGHIANANYMICSRATGADSPSKEDIEKTKSSKADLSKAVADSFAFCEAQFDGLDGAKAAEMIDFFGGMKLTRLAVLQFTTAHDFEHYGNLVTYMRIKGMVPPSSQGGM